MMSANTRTALEHNHHTTTTTTTPPSTHNPASMESVLVDQRTGAQGPQNHQEPNFELGVSAVMKPLTKHHLQNCMTCHKDGHLGFVYHLSLFLENRAFCNFNATKRDGCTTIGNTKSFGLHQKCSMSLTLILDRRRASHSQSKHIESSK